ncbi:hypothetical protein ElyMa_003028600 [Elysia marginata]|uniref:Uncharacterized protein n=1 Tax=Elysia marginata TaxID=1093978 RepID=A0AAV4IFV0_9GAST|nr:hypothetical protein ElyMa_003028600 [Elysia marginata]
MGLPQVTLPTGAEIFKERPSNSKTQILKVTLQICNHRVRTMQQKSSQLNGSNIFDQMAPYHATGQWPTEYEQHIYQMAPYNVTKGWLTEYEQHILPDGAIQCNKRLAN